MNETRSSVPSPSAPGMIDLIRKAEEISYENVMRMYNILTNLSGEKSEMPPQVQPECLLDDVKALFDYTSRMSELLGQLNALMVGG